MDSTQSVSVELPDELYQRIREIAERNDRSVESVLRESLEVMFGAVAVDPDTVIARLDSYSDDQLWAVVYQRIAWPQRERLRDLITLGKTGKLSPDEHTELNTLLDQADRYTLVRTHALRKLQQRGHDVNRYLQQGA